MYKLLRSLLFLFDAEKVHYFSMNTLRQLVKVGFARNWIQKKFKPASLPVNVWGLHFKNPVGLGAGFDKNALYLKELSILGFGFIETGTVTPVAQQGNDRPRLFRLSKDKALINRMGFNNDGAEIIAGRLQQYREKFSTDGLIIGANIGKNKSTPNHDAWKDYLHCYKTLYHHADYFVVNVSSPNTSGLRDLQEKSALHKILTSLQKENSANKPLLLKIAPDLSDTQLQDVIDLAGEIKLHGLIIANTTLDRKNLKSSTALTTQTGGLSGRPLFTKSTDILAKVSTAMQADTVLIASGGIFSGSDACEKINNGATLVQVWTGFIYVGPGIVKKIVNALN